MRLEDYFEFVGPDEIRIKGHRLGIEHVVEYYDAGYSPEQIAETLPGLPLETVYASITYYLRHHNEVAAYVAWQKARCEEEYQRWAASPSAVIQRLRRLGARQGQQSA